MQIRKGMVLLVAGLTLTAAGSAIGFAGGRRILRHCSFDFTALNAQVKVISGNPPASGSNLLAATLNGNLCGVRLAGAARVVNTYPRLGKFTSQARMFGPLGALIGSASGTGKPDSAGGISFHARGKITGGTGAYKNANGSLSATGTQAKGSSVVDLHIIGTFSY